MPEQQAMPLRVQQGHPSARHDEIRGLLAYVLCEAGLKDVETEPSLLPFEGKISLASLQIGLRKPVWTSRLVDFGHGSKMLF